VCVCVCLLIIAFSALTLLVGRQDIWPVKTEQWGAGVVICLERGADLHMAQRIPLSLTVSCFRKIQIGFTFLVPAHPGSPGQWAVKRVCVCVFLLMTVTVVTVTRLIFCNICLKVAFIFDSQASPFGGRPMSEIASRYPYEKCTFGGTYALLTIDSSSLCVCFMQSSNQYQYHAAGASHSHNVMRLVPTISVATSSC